MFKQIIVPIDGSSCADQAVDVAAALAKEQNATCTVVMVVDIAQAAALGFATPDLVNGWLETVQDQARAVVDDAAARLRAQGVSVQTEVAEGNPTDAILQVAKKRRGDLIVMGSHGRSGLRRLFLGSVAEAVLRSADIPVLVVRQSGLKAVRAA
ncbi:MAG TPA: universal stress protein [Candidatus Rubrimentiphilum sp.]|nr:universal stress protein [Candidatus Rubrimentiphilum sp.]